MTDIMKDIAVLGKFSIELFDKNNKLKKHTIVHNRVVNTGLNMIAEWFGHNPNEIQHLTLFAIGTDGTDVTGKETKLLAQVASAPLVNDPVRDHTSVLFEGKFGPSVPSTRQLIRECGLINGVGGNLFNRCVFAPINKGPDDTLIIRYTITVVTNTEE